MKPTAVDQNYYSVYQTFKAYKEPELKKKHIKYYDRHFWFPTETKPDMSVLEIGCGTGHFLRYLHFKDVTQITGVDRDPALENFIHPDVKAHFVVAEIFDYLDFLPSDNLFDRIVMFDVLEHFDRRDGKRLLQRLAQILNKNGCIVAQVPNMSSPWGAQYQFGDLTHKAAYTPESMRQLALASGLESVTCYPQVMGSRSRKLFGSLLHALLSKALSEAPKIWSGNFITILRR